MHATAVRRSGADGGGPDPCDPDACGWRGRCSEQPCRPDPRDLLRPRACPGASACPIRITFARGAYSGQASSTLTGITSRRWFVVSARAGQSMIVIVKGAGPTRGIVHFPNGQSDGQPGGRVFDDQLPVSGNYRIEVSESQMAEAWRGRVTVIVVIY